MPALSLPERAVVAFERASGLTVVFHDFASPLGAAFRPERSWHTGTLCRTVKHVRWNACMAFDVALAHRTVRADQQVRLKICHAGIVEWMVGIHAGGRVCAVLYAGQRRADGLLAGALVPASRQSPHGPWSAQVAALPAVDDAAAAWIGELLAQLAARLSAWCAEHTAIPVSTPAPTGRDRRARIQRFIVQEHAKPIGLPALARLLGLSPTRAGHVVQELFGRPFLALRDEARLRTAAEMLRSTAMPLTAVAAACGFRDPSRFHRVFRRVHGATPGAFRRSGGTPAEP